MHAHWQLRVVQPLGNSTEDFAEVLSDRLLDAFHQERVYCVLHH